MSIDLAPSSVEVSRHHAFYTAEQAADYARPKLEEMLDVLWYVRDQLGRSMSAAHAAYGAPFDTALMRNYVVCRYTIDVLDRIVEHRAKVAPMLFPELAPKRGRG